MKADPEVLRGLLERVRAGTGMDRDLDREIHFSLGFRADQVVHSGTNRVPLWNAYTLSREAVDALAWESAPDLMLTEGDARASLEKLLAHVLAQQEASDV